MPSALSPKEKLKAEFSRSYEKYYQVRLFTELGFMRRKCPSCGSFFWTLDSERKHCPNPPCENYGFIGNPPIKPMDYIDTWRTIERFFVKNGHESVPSYPVVCRWFPGLYFTVASIVAFQRSVAGETVFEMPAERIIIPQVCLRFIDTENVGVTGRHMTNFIMVGQHSIYEKVSGVQKGYWKDTCIQLDYELLTKVLGLKPEEVTFMEDVWVGPNAFGYSLEYYTRGLELGNAVFTEFVGTPDKYRQMDNKVIDMGAGLERFTWMSQGTPTAYDAVYGPVMKELKKAADVDEDVFRRYAAIAGGLNIDEAGDIVKVKAGIAKALGVTVADLDRNVEPMQALYAIADHTKTLLYAISDGGLLSNVGGGYNLRMIFRRALGFIDRFGLDVDLHSVCRSHARYLKPLNSRLEDSLAELQEILGVEEKRYRATKERGRAIVHELMRKKEPISEAKLAQLYESNGITPELIKEAAEKEGASVEVPPDFYQQMTSRHMKEEAGEENPPIPGLTGLPATKLLFYENEAGRSFEAKVLATGKGDGHWVVLDRTLFYPEGGGQDFDTGTINGALVTAVRKFGQVVAHRMEHAGFKPGDTVKGTIDWDRRLQLSQHHTAVHIINGAARHLLGNHVWQAGAAKTVEKAHLDITHYESLGLEAVEKLEAMSNETVAKALPISKTFMSRSEAEKRYGMRIYQGGAIPDKTIRIVSTPGWDVEACAGTHLGNTKDAGKIVIVSAERVQDGIDRITLKAGKAAAAYLDVTNATATKVESLLELVGLMKFKWDAQKRGEFVILDDLRRCAAVFSVGMEQLENTVRKFADEIRLFEERLGPNRHYMTFKDLNSACTFLFETWKSLRKAAESRGNEMAGEISAGLIGRAKGGAIIELVEADRAGLIKAASAILEKAPKLTVLLANSVGDVVGMSKSADMGAVVARVCEKLGGRGGGRGPMGQGKIPEGALIRKISKSDLGL